MNLKKGEKIKVFSNTDVQTYIDYFDSIGLKSKLDGEYIVITGYSQKRGTRKRYYDARVKDFAKLNDIGERIRGIRKKMYFSIEELAEEIGTNPITIDAWECGRIIPKGQAFQQFLELSGATREYVMDGKGEWIDEIKLIMNELHKENE